MLSEYETRYNYVIDIQTIIGRPTFTKRQHGLQKLFHHSNRHGFS